MEPDEISNSNDVEFDQKTVLRPAVLLKDREDIFVYPGTKRILNWKFSSISDAIADIGPHDLSQFSQHHKSDSQTYLSFNDFNYDSLQQCEVSNASSNTKQT